MTKSQLPQEEIVIKYIKELLYSGKLNPGDRLPAERRLAELLDVSRIHVRSALQKLEFYGIIKTFPQSGSVVAQLKVQALERMITDVLKIDQYDFHSLVEVRSLLEAEAIKLCARNRTEEDLATIEEAMLRCEEFFHNEQHRVDNDFAFHQAIAQGSGNPVIASMLLIITPDILRYYREYNACSAPQEQGVVTQEHREMFRCIKEKDVKGAEVILLQHLKNIREFANKNNEKNHYLEYSIDDMQIPNAS